MMRASLLRKGPVLVRRTRVGLWYETASERRTDGQVLRTRYEVVSDNSSADGCVTVRNQAGEEFPVMAELIDMVTNSAAKPAELRP